MTGGREMPFLMEFDEKIRQENGMLNSFTQTTNQDLKIIKRNLIGWKNKNKTRLKRSFRERGDTEAAK